MDKAFNLKVVGMLALILLMSFALSYVNDTILERQRYQVQVKSDIAKSAASSQTILGPILAVPYIEEYTEYIDEITEKGTQVKKAVLKHSKSTAYFLPENLHLKGAFSNEHKKLGIYKALMYTLSGKVTGDFRIPANYQITPQYKNGVILFQSAYIGFGISDTRGIIGTPTFQFDKKSYKFEQGVHINGLGKGIHATLGSLNAKTEQIFDFEFSLNLLGLEHFSFTPIAENNTVKLSSPWPHPHFDGSFLPIKKRINDSGFSSEWEISSLSSSNQSIIKPRLLSGKEINHLESLSVGFIEPINVYSQADRATKYGLLFISLTFIGFFLFELLKQLRIHPAQYTLVGLAMAMFYLLLISFAEIIGFASAYLIASVSCILLLGYYLSYVLNGKAHAFAFASFLTALYGALYGILASEDNAMLMGSLLIFGLLAAVMVMTRKVDWYALSAEK